MAQPPVHAGYYSNHSGQIYDLSACDHGAIQNSDVATIQKAFEPYNRTTILSQETDPNKLHDLKAALDAFQVYSQTEIDDLAAKYLRGAGREQLDPILDSCVATYVNDLDEDQQVEFKGKAKAFVRTYGFLSSIPTVHECGVGEALDLPQLLDLEVACAEGGRPFKGCSGNDRHGQLPRREEGTAPKQKTQPGLARSVGLNSLETAETSSTTAVSANPSGIQRDEAIYPGQQGTL